MKGAVITCMVVVLYLSFCSWRFQQLEKSEGENSQTLVINVKY